MSKLIVGNWKMNGSSDSSAALATAIAEHVRSAGPGCDVVLCPPHVFLPAVLEASSATAVSVGGQDCHFEASGAFTGDISAEMLADLGCDWVIVGHSERRTEHREDDPMVWSKANAAHRAGLKAIICVGETAEERDRGDTLDVVCKQVAGCLPDAASATNAVIAYEPVWAIGTGRTPTVEEVAEVHLAIRGVLADRMADGGGVHILYGGSVKPGNAAELLHVENVDGALVGGASLDAGDFCAIIDATG